MIQRKAAEKVNVYLEASSMCWEYVDVHNVIVLRDILRSKHNGHIVTNTEAKSTEESGDLHY
jgi:hypothetical protein